MRPLRRSRGLSFSVNSGDIIHPPCSERRSAKIAGDHAPCDWGGRMPVSLGKIEKYRREANRCAELAKEASPAFLAEIYRKVALRYVFMAEELLRGAVRDGDAIEKADRMNSSMGVT